MSKHKSVRHKFPSRQRVCHRKYGKQDIFSHDSEDQNGEIFESESESDIEEGWHS